MSKQISLAELDQLKKYLGVTFSVHDGEALAGMRRANALLKKYNLTWADVLNRTVAVGMTNGEVVEETELTLEKQTEMAFNEIRGTAMSRSFAAFIESLEDTFLRTRYLSPDQRRPLFNAVREHRRKRAKDE